MARQYLLGQGGSRSDHPHDKNGKIRREARRRNGIGVGLDNGVDRGFIPGFIEPSLSESGQIGKAMGLIEVFDRFRKLAKVVVRLGKGELERGGLGWRKQRGCGDAFHLVDQFAIGN